jgi:hypothetical protein
MNDGNAAFILETNFLDKAVKQRVHDHCKLPAHVEF